MFFMGNTTQAKDCFAMLSIRENVMILWGVLTLTKYRVIQAGLLTDVWENRR